MVLDQLLEISRGRQN